MSLVLIREYFKARILEIDPEFSEHKNPFSTDDIAATQMHKTFQVATGPITGNAVNQGATDDTIQVIVTLFYSGGREVQESFDQGIDQGNAVRLNAMSPKKMALVPSIRRVFCSSVEPVPREANGSTFGIAMSFIVRAGFALG